jgi:hypothetical protein
VAEPVARCNLPSFNRQSCSLLKLRQRGCYSPRHVLICRVMGFGAFPCAPRSYTIRISSRPQLISRQNKNAPDSNESWDVSVEQPSPENCSITMYCSGVLVGMARLGYASNLRLFRQFERTVMTSKTIELPTRSLSAIFEHPPPI